jgi:hypothetical protein
MITAIVLMAAEYAAPAENQMISRLYRNRTGTGRPPWTDTFFFAWMKPPHSQKFESIFIEWI